MLRDASRGEGELGAEEIVERVKRLVELLPREGSREIMTAKEAAEFLRLPYSQFKRIAGEIPRHAVTERRYVYYRKELIEWVLSR